MQYVQFLWSALAILALVISVWAVSVKIKDASIIDIFWGFGFVVVGFVMRLTAGGPWTFRRNLLWAAVTIWGLRLTLHLAKRNIGKGEDFRYKLMRKKYGAKFPIISLRTVYLAQGGIMFLVSLPIQVGLMRHDDKKGFAALLIIGAIVWFVGLAFETIGDLQLTAFGKDPANKGKVLDTGLWAWTRHPNYFGDTCAWWGMWLMAASVLPGVFTIVGPIIMTFMLTKVSGVPLLEKKMGTRRPGYEEYVQRTSAFIPRPPRRK
jgi:steroid 5-alpha reductase family enzyme